MFFKNAKNPMQRWVQQLVFHNTSFYNGQVISLSCYHLIIIITLSMTQSDHIKGVPLYLLEAMCISYISMFMFRLDAYGTEPWYLGILSYPVTLY